MNWKSFFENLALAALAGAAQAAGSQLPGTPGQGIQWRPVGNAAALGALLGALAHLGTAAAQPQPQTAPQQ